MSDSLWPHGLGLYSPWNSLGQNTLVNSLSLLQGIFPTQGLNPGFQHCRWILYQLSHKGSPRILEWVVYPFFSGSSWPRDWTGIFCITGEFFTNWAIREILMFIAALFTVTRTWKPSRCPLTDEWIKRMWCIYTIENCYCCLVAKSCLTLLQSHGL